MKPSTPNQGLRLFRTGGASLLLALALAGCSIVGPSREPTTVYAPDPKVRVDPAWPRLDAQLTVVSAETPRSTDGLRIAVRPTPLELQVYKGASWAQRPSDMVEAVVVRTLQDSGGLRAVARQGSGIGADYRLVLDARRFESSYSAQPEPSAMIEVNATLLHAADARIVAARAFRYAEPAASTHVEAVAAAFENALAQLGHDVAGWVLTQGAAHERAEHPNAPR